MDSIEPLSRGLEGTIIGFAIHSSMGLAVVVMVTDGVGGGGGKRRKVGWVAIGVGEGGVDVQGRVRLAESWCERSRLLSSSS